MYTRGSNSSYTVDYHLGSGHRQIVYSKKWSAEMLFIFSERTRDVDIAIVKRGNQLVDIVQKRK